VTIPPLPGLTEADVLALADEQACRRWLVDRVGMSEDEAREAAAAIDLTRPLAPGHTGRPAGCPCPYPPIDRRCRCAHQPLIEENPTCAS